MYYRAIILSIKINLDYLGTRGFFLLAVSYFRR